LGRRAAVQRLELAADLAAALDLDGAITDVAADASGRADMQQLLHDEVAFEASGDIGGFDLRLALEHAGLGDLDGADIAQGGIDPPPDDRPFAGLDLAGEDDLAADDQTLAVAVDDGPRIGASHRRCGNVG